MNRSLNLTPMRSRRVAMLLTVMLVLALPSITRHSAMEAATCVTNPVVMNNSDSGAGSLRQAILDACDGTTITFANTVASPITLASELAIDENLTIQGPGAGALTISGNNAVRVFNIGSLNPSINVTLSGLTISNGNATFISGPSASGFFGGGIFSMSAGAVTVSNSTVCANHTTSDLGGPDGFGGAICHMGTGTVTVSGCTVSSNGAEFGGGIFSDSAGTLVLSNTSISNNTTTGNGAGVHNTGALTFSNCSFTGNNAGSSFGGGLYNRGIASGSMSSFSGNSAVYGAGIYNSYKLNLTGLTISANTATSVGGGIYGTGPLALLNVMNSTISNNGTSNSGGGVYLTAGGVVNVLNTTIAGNTAHFNGGGIVPSGTTSIVNSTIAGNIAGGQGGGVWTFAQFGGGDYLGTIIALNTSPVGPDTFGPAVSQGHNLVGKSNGGTGFVNGVNGDQVGSVASPIDPKLGPLQNNGGPTSTMALLPGSPAIDAGDDAVLGAPLFLTTDQRGPGFPRRSGVHVDIGAFELQVFFDTCLKDDRSGNLLQFNSTSGQYKFIRCSDGFMLSGTGVVRLVNGILTLTDSKPDRRVSAGFITSQRTGSATIYIMIAPGVWQTFRINSTNPNAVCSC
jgi:hypothetical protein